MTDKPKTKKQTILTLSNGREYIFDFTDEQHKALVNRIRTIRVPNQFIEDGDLLIRVTDVSSVERR